MFIPLVVIGALIALVCLLALAYRLDAAEAPDAGSRRRHPSSRPL